MNRFSLVGGVAVLLIGGCKVGPDYSGPPELPGVSGGWVEPGDSGGVAEDPDLSWWRLFDDPLLNEMIESAVAENPGLRAIEARVRRARALRGESAGAMYPEIDASGSYSRERTGARPGDPGGGGGSARNLYRGGLEASWELDIFGGVRRSVEAADARVEGALETSRARRLAVIAEVARSYLEFRQLQERIAILDKNIASQADTLRLVEDQFEIGEATEFDLTRARGQLQATRSQRPEFEADLSAAAYRLAVLLGRTPDGIRRELGPLPQERTLPDALPVGQRADILRRRPDVRAAERELAAALADVGVATADLFPRFFLLGSAGRAAQDLDDLRDSSTDFYSLGQLVEWRLFEGGALRAAVGVEEAEADEAVALYEGVVYEALADAESALNRYVRLREAMKFLREAASERRRSAALAVSLFEGGEEDFLSVLDAERELAIADDERVLSENRVRLAAVNLFASLGGGWQPFEEAERSGKTGAEESGED